MLYLIDPEVNLEKSDDLTDFEVIEAVDFLGDEDFSAEEWVEINDVVDQIWGDLLPEDEDDDWDDLPYDEFLEDLP